MSIFDPSLHPRGHALNAGGFSDKPQSAPEATLPAQDTEQPLKQLSLHAMNRSVAHFVSTDYPMTMDQEYQRGSVWDTSKRQALMKSLLMGLPIGAVTVNDRHTINGAFGEDGYAIIDGKQRIEALHAYKNDEFGIPASWLEQQDVESTTTDPDTGQELVYHSNGTLRFQRSFSHFPITTVEARVKSVEEEAAIFRLINSAGVAQSDETMANALAVENGGVNTQETASPGPHRWSKVAGTWTVHLEDERVFATSSDGTVTTTDYIINTGNRIGWKLGKSWSNGAPSAKAIATAEQLISAKSRIG